MSTQVAKGVVMLTRAESGLSQRSPADTGAAQDVLRVHHGASKTTTGLAANRRVWHAYFDLHTKTNGWSDIGYSFGVARGDDPEHAIILTGRGWGRIGAHTFGHNEDLGVVFIGNGTDGSMLTPAVKRAFAYLRRAKHDGPRRAFGHRDTSQTACPGDALYAWVHAGMPMPADGSITVREGEGLRQAARRAGGSVDQLVAANPSILLKAGQRLVKPR